MSGVRPLPHDRPAELIEFFDDQPLGLMGIHPASDFSFESIQQTTKTCRENGVGMELGKQFRIFLAQGRMLSFRVG